MATRTGTSKGVARLRGSRQEYLRYELSAHGSQANFSQDDDQPETVVTDQRFPGEDRCIWRLQASADQGGTRITATDGQGNPLPPYSRIATQLPIPVYSIGLVFGTAKRYTLKVDLCSPADGLIENITNVRYTDGAAGESATETLSLDLGEA